MATPLEGTESAALAIQRVKYTHDAMIDLMLANPSISQNKLAEHFGYTVGWVSRVICSDAFQARLAERKTELIDPTIVMKVEEKFSALANKSLDILQEKLARTESADLALKTLDLASKALGFGAKKDTVVNNSYVVALPPKAPNASAWAEAFTPGGKIVQGEVISG